MTFGSLFSGIGGFDLGLERSGMTCAWQVEIDPFCRKVLARHWPDVPRHDDIRTFAIDGETRDLKVDLICGGFPCQDISYAGKGAGLDGQRSGLWHEFARVVRVLRPRLVLVENVPALLVRGLDRVLGTLAEMGYDAEWGCLSAASVGALHLRDRAFILADSEGFRRRAGGAGRTAPPGEVRETPGADVPDADRAGLEVWTCFGGDAWAKLATLERGGREGSGVWAVEPELGRVADGVPDRVDRLRGLGNAVVPQVAQFIGGRIMEARR